MFSLHRYMRRPSPSMLVALFALLIASAGVASAAIPDGAGTIHGCYANRTGTLRVIDTEASPPGTCNPTKETALSWNEQGVAGAPGAPGDTGPAGWVGSTYVVTGASGSFSLAFCDEGDFATGGGGLGTNYLLEVAPLTDNTESATGETPNGYAARVLAGGFDQVQVWVICVDVTP